MLRVNVLHLRWVSMIEGVSYLLLVCVGMPLKYVYQMGFLNKVFGMFHGGVTIIFIFVLVQVWRQQKLGSFETLLVFVASLIPGGAFVAEHRLKRM